MRRSKVRKLIKKVTCLICVIAVCVANSERIYAMETLMGQIEEKIQIANAREYEMNIVLDDLLIKSWNRPPYSMDEIDNPVDEPLGQYSEERLKEYTDEDFRVEFEYCCGYYGSGVERKDWLHLIQIARIYKDGKLYVLEYCVWTGYAIHGANGISDAVCGSGCYALDKDDYKTRVEKYYESME